MSLATKPIKKVAEARARKRKRAAQRLVNAKKKATALAANPGGQRFRVLGVLFFFVNQLCHLFHRTRQTLSVVALETRKVVA